jgi:hypothetical protein
MTSCHAADASSADGDEWGIRAPPTTSGCCYFRVSGSMRKAFVDTFDRAKQAAVAN